MSYGVLASKSASVLVEESLGGAETGSDRALTRFLAIWGPTWVPGRLTVTRLHANFIPVSAGRGMAMMDLALRDVRDVQLTGSRWSRVLVVRTGTHLVQVRASGAAGLAPQLTQLVAGAKRVPLPEV